MSRTSETGSNAADHDGVEYNSVVQIKRFLERWTADPAFRDHVVKDPKGAMQRYRLAVDPDEIRAIWDDDYDEEAAPVPDAVQRYRDWYNGQVEWRDQVIADSAPSDARFKVWRERQIARCKMQMYAGNKNTVVHAPVCFELCRGCSVGCWFCGVAAEPLSTHMPYTSENAEFWRSTLHVVSEAVGPGARQGFCYWATEPLDNPDYERFCLDHAEILGLFPQTTTAVPMKNVDRTRALLKLSRKHGCDVNRFSLSSLSQIEEVYEEFSAEELKYVEIIAQNKQSYVVKANAGHFRERAKQAPKLVEHEEKKLERAVEKFTKGEIGSIVKDLLKPPTSIACVSGFLFNMVDRTVKLISPCEANDRWPLGYIVFDEGRFETASELRSLMEGFIEKHMKIGFEHDDIVRFLPDLKYAETEEGFRVSSRFKDADYKSPDNPGYIQALGRLIRSGGKSAGEISLVMFYQFGIAQDVTIMVLGELRKLGVLCEPLQASSDHPGNSVAVAEPVAVQHIT